MHCQWASDSEINDDHGRRFIATPLAADRRIAAPFLLLRPLAFPHQIHHLSRPSEHRPSSPPLHPRGDVTHQLYRKDIANDQRLHQARRHVSDHDWRGRVGRHKRHRSQNLRSSRERGVGFQITPHTRWDYSWGLLCWFGRGLL